MFGLRLGKLGAAIRAGTGSAGVTPLFSRDYETDGSLGADATFTRASTATYVDSNGVIQTAAINTPRFDYSTGSRALLMEPAATNLITRSEGVSSWTVIGVCTVTQSVTNLAGVTAFDLSGCSAAWHSRAPIINANPDATAVAISVLCLVGHSGRIDIKDETAVLTSSVVFNGVGGATVTSTSAGAITVVVEHINNAYKYKLVLTTTQGNLLSVFIGPNTTNPSVVLTCTAAQLEAGTTPTSYIPTSGSAVTRAADALSYSGIAADNETRAITDAGTVDVDDWDGVVDDAINGADNLAQISSITVYTTGDRPA